MIAVCFQLSILLSLIISYLSEWRVKYGDVSNGYSNFTREKRFVEIGSSGGSTIPEDNIITLCSD